MPSARSPYTLLYVALTAVIGLALLAVTASLGRRPLLLQGVIGSAGDWVALRSSDGRYSIEIPADWTWLQAQNATSRATLADRLQHEPRLQSALAPLTDLIGDEEVLLLAENGSSFLILARSPSFAHVAVPDFLSALRAESFPTSTFATTTAVENDTGQAAALLEVHQSDSQLSCRQMVLPAPRSGYLAAACTGPQQIETHQELFVTMLTSLQVRN